MSKNIPLQDYQNVPKNVRNKKTRNPGYQPGNHWIICDRCGCAIRSQDAIKEWTGLWVCPDDWEMRHPQDFVRGRADEIAPSEPYRPEGPNTFVEQGCLETAVVGIAVVGCAVVGVETAPSVASSDIPPGTFNNSL